MMMNIFSSFDPSTSSMFSLNWMSTFLFMLFFPYQYWLFPSQINYFWSLNLKFMFKEFKALINYSFLNLIIFMSFFLMIFFNNFLGLFPYIFTSSSHMSFNLSMSLSLWMAMMFYWILNYFNEMFTHLTPQSTPLLLMPFMVMIESISLIIRPLTLSIRLMANMIAGHILLILLGNSILNTFSLKFMFFMYFIQILLYILEISVSLIQAYVFSILSTLYSSEM